MSLESGLEEFVEVTDGAKEDRYEISLQAREKFDKLMGDDELSEDKERPETGNGRADHFAEYFEQLFGKNREASFDESQEVTHQLSKTDTFPEQELFSPEMDDTGKVFKADGKLLPNTRYMLEGSTYVTNEYGSIISCDAQLKYSPEGDRNLKEQREAGADERLEGDDGGHIVARMLGGTEGSENLVPMRRTLNRGDYKIMENQIAKALQEGKDASLHLDLSYSDHVQRPDLIKSVYSIDGNRTEILFENQENSTELLKELKSKITAEDYRQLENEIDDMEKAGHSATITSIKTEYNEYNQPVQVTIGLLDELMADKSYKKYQIQ